MAKTEHREGTLDVIVPIYNELNGCQQFHDTLASVLGRLHYRTRVIYVDDGSTDGTTQKLWELSQHGGNVVVVEFSRNFGHQAALTAGLSVADADAIIMMDGDGQHPPGLIPEMVNLFEAGFEIVQTQRVDPPGTIGPLKRITSNTFYSLLNRLGELDIGNGVADFRLISREVAVALREMREYHRFLRGMIPWLGFKTVLLPFTPSSRLAGSTKYTFRKMLRLASDGLFSFSLFPLRLGVFLGTLLLLFACAEITYVAMFFIRGRAHELVPGWSSLMIMLTLSSGVTMVLLGFIGIYVGMIFQQVKSRPVYVIRRCSNTLTTAPYSSSVTRGPCHERD